MKKKILSVFMAVLSMALAACGNQSAQSTSSAAEQNKKQLSLVALPFHKRFMKQLK